MEKSRWIWYPGDYEIYHSLLLHSRREEFGAEYPCFWGMANVYPRVNFEKNCRFERDGYIIIHANCNCYALIDGRRYPRGERISVPAGEHNIQVVAIKHDGLPAIYCESDQLISDKSWKCSPGTAFRDVNAGDDPAYTSVDDNVEVFPFAYTGVKPVSAEKTDGGILYDFGRELFAKLDFECGSGLTVYYGETAEEATDTANTLVFEKVGAGKHSLVPRAFRYAMLTGEAAEVQAWLELLPVEYKAKFSCDRPEVEKIFNVCAYTFHLNSREFLLDGIKRDRWCWSGDAYQSYMVNDYLFADRALNRRTITALYGKPPVLEHINTINDYSALLLIGTYEYYYTTGDLDFIRFIWPRAKALYDFVISRLDENGLVVQRPGDWIFIDWSDIDKDGPLCAEQILLWQAHNSMKALSEALGEPGAEVYSERADRLKALINEKYWDKEHFAYIDSFTSGRNHITRHANIFAILYDFVDRETAEGLVRSVLENDSITKITTPYFELYELMALCKLGHIEYAQNMIDSYWGGMLKLGATTIWEQYDPTQSGVEHYGMYGSRFGKSLCHAWGSGPVYLLGRYCLGVHPTSVGAKTFAIEPNPGLYTELHGVVPIGEGLVSVDFADGALSVSADIDGGSVIWKGKTYLLTKGEKFTITE